jgi:hypothetical protein
MWLAAGTLMLELCDEMRKARATATIAPIIKARIKLAMKALTNLQTGIIPLPVYSPSGVSEANKRRSGSRIPSDWP